MMTMQKIMNMRKMMKMKGTLLTAAAFVVMALGSVLASGSLAALGAKDSAEGKGTLVHEDGTRSEFEFSAKRNPNGKVSGQATIRNPSYRAANGQVEKIKVEISCLKVEGRVAILGGETKRKNNQAEVEAVYFAVEDNGAGAADAIFRGFYYDDEAATRGEAALCETLKPEVLVFEPLAAGYVTVKDK